MAQQTLPPTPTFNYAGLQSSGDFLPELKLEEGKKAMVSFLDEIPGMQNPPFVFCKVHWNSEMGDNGRMFQCFGGSCCQQVTWQKGWGGEPGKFEPNKARTRYFIPLVHYCQDETHPAVMKAEVKHLNLTWSAYDALVKAVQNTTEGLSFFERDITLEATKVNGATIYLFHKGESIAQWRQNEIFRQQVEEQLPTVALKLCNAMPKTMTEAEFMEMKPQLDAKVQAAMASHNAVQQAAQPQIPGYPQQAVPGYPQQPVPGYPPQQAMYQQPQFNIPVQGVPAQATPVLNGNVQGVPVPGVPTPPVNPAPVAQPAGTITAQPPVQGVQEPIQQAAVPTQPVEIPKAELEFDPSQVLK